MDYRIIFLRSDRSEPEKLIECEAEDDHEALTKLAPEELPKRSQAIVMSERWTARYRLTESEGWRLAGDPVAVEQRPFEKR